MQKSLAQFFSSSIKFILFALLAACASSPLTAKGFRYVIIDAGHGGNDPGAQVGRLYEKHLALDTAKRLNHFLRKKGIRTIMTRRSDRFLTLQQRADIANRYRNSIFVSIHYNWTWKKHVSGIETFQCSPRGKTLASYVQYGMLSKLRRYRPVNRKVKYRKFYVLRHTKNPAILVEGGFMSHSKESRRLRKGWYRQKIAEGIGNGILRYQTARKRGRVW